MKTGFKKYDSSYKRKESPFTDKKLLKKVSSQLKAASKKHAGQAAKIDKATSAMKVVSKTKPKPPPTPKPVKNFPSGKLPNKREKASAMKKEVPSHRIKSKLKPRKTLVGSNYKRSTITPMKKISGPCKAAAKRKFKVWPSAYASGWGVRCTKAGGPSKFGG
tara:strand:- start:51 stop:536 length:486 start_codon:yes stop_codon:yes gene_type:complete